MLPAGGIRGLQQGKRREQGTTYHTGDAQNTSVLNHVHVALVVDSYVTGRTSCSGARLKAVTDPHLRRNAKSAPESSGCC